MSIYIKGKEAELVSVQADGEQVLEIWADDKMVWPDITGESGGILIEPPAASEWRYWLHALDGVEKGDINHARYMKFEADGVDYYINRAPRGKQRVLLEGNIIKLTAAQQAALAGKVGATLEIKVEMPEREAEWRSFENANNPNVYQEIFWPLPVLSGSFVRINVWKGQKREYGYVNVSKVTSWPSQGSVDVGYSHILMTRGRYYATLESEPVQADGLSDRDGTMSVTFNTYGAADSGKGIIVVFPAFSKIFSVNVLAEF